MTYALKIENLSKNFGDFALEDISLEIPTGSIMGLIGENGAGKTSLIKALLNIIKKDSGRVYYLGQDFSQGQVSLKESIGVVLDGDFFQDNLRPQDLNKIFKSLYSNWQEERFFHYLEKFKLPQDKISKDFSKGMKTKLSIAVALSHQAKLLILDEPTSGLDPITRMEILDELLDFIQDGDSSVLFSSHITSDLDKVADYISFIQDGRLVFTKDREELLSDYGIVRSSLDQLDKIPKEIIISLIKNKYNVSVLIKDRSLLGDDFIIDKATTEEIMLFFIRGEKL